MSVNMQYLFFVSGFDLALWSQVTGSVSVAGANFCTGVSSFYMTQRMPFTESIRPIENPRGLKLLYSECEGGAF